VRALFAEYGEVDRVTLITDRFSGQPKGFGFVEMPTQGAAENAISALDGKDVKGRNIKVNQARPRAERPQRRPR
jgi:RNA recognition motif-containing protein